MHYVIDYRFENNRKLDRVCILFEVIKKRNCIFFLSKNENFLLPSLNWSSAFRFPHPPSGNSMSWSKSLSDCTLCLIDSEIKRRDSGFSLFTYSGWVYRIRSATQNNALKCRSRKHQCYEMLKIKIFNTLFFMY